jgi:arginase family enzyme
VIQAISENYIPVVLGGDHSLAIGSVTGILLYLILK